MPDLATRITEHPINSILASVATELDRAEARPADPAEVVQMLARQRAIRDAAVAVLGAADPLLVPEQILVALQNNAQAWRDQLNAFAGSGSMGQLQNAMTNADGVLINLSQIPTLGANKTRDVTAARAYYGSVQKFTEHVDARFADLDQRASAAASRLDELLEQVKQTTTNVQNIASQQQQQFSQAQEDRIVAFGDAQQERTSEAAALLAQQRASAEAINKQAQEHFLAVGADVEDRVRQIVEAGRAGVEEMRVHYDKVAQALMADLEQHRRKAGELVGLIAERGVTSHYQKVANEARITMWVWQGITFVTLGVFLIVAIVDFLPALRTGWNWGAVAGRFFVTVAVALLAGYAGAEARESQKVMRANRQREMDLAAVGPYLADFPPDRRDEFRLKYADHIFIPEPLLESPQAAAASVDGQSVGNTLAAIIKIGDTVRAALGK